MRVFIYIFLYFLFNNSLFATPTVYTFTDNGSWLAEAYGVKEVELLNANNKWVTINEDYNVIYIIKEGQQSGEIEDFLTGEIPYGEYSALRMKLMDWRIKGWVYINGTKWYTKETTDKLGDDQTIGTTDVNEHGFWKLDMSALDLFSYKYFTKKITVNKNGISGLNYVIIDNGDEIQTQDEKSGSPEGIYMQKDHIFNGFVTGTPKTMVKIKYRGEKVGNTENDGDTTSTIILLLDKNGEVIGADHWRDRIGNTLVWGQGFSKGDFIKLNHNGSVGEFKVYIESTDEELFNSKKIKTFLFEGDYNCDLGISKLSRISSVDVDGKVVDTHPADNLTQSPYPDVLNKSWGQQKLIDTGTTTCTELVYQ